MKEIFLNATRCAYNAAMQGSILDCVGISCSSLADRYFHSLDYSIFTPALKIIKKCLNLEEHVAGPDIYYMDAFGRKYEDEMLLVIFSVKHKDPWYDNFWSCIIEENCVDGMPVLLEEAVRDYEEKEEKFEKFKEMMLHV